MVPLIEPTTVRLPREKSLANGQTDKGIF